MTNPPTFTVQPTSQRGQSLFQWHTGPSFGELRSLQMPTEIAEHLAGLAAREVKLTAALTRFVEVCDSAPPIHFMAHLGQAAE